MKEGRRKKNQDAGRKTHEDFFNNILPLTLFVRFAFERLMETEHKLHILTPLLWPSRCVFIVLLMLGSTPSGLSEGPLGLVWPSLPHLVSNPLGVCWQLHQGFPRSPSVGCGLPYHIWSLMSGTLLTTASGVSEVPLSRLWPSLPHLVSNPLGVCWQLHRGFSRSPSVGCGLPYHISSLTLWESAGNCLGPKLNWVK